MYLHNKYWWQSERGTCITYAGWINTNYPTRESCVNQCAVAVRNMVGYFNNLTVQVGYANGIYHCWCKDSDGNIVDPTSKQFDAPINYHAVAGRSLHKHEIELSTGAIFLDNECEKERAS